MLRHTVSVQLAAAAQLRTYPIHIGTGLLGAVSSFDALHHLGRLDQRTAVIVSNTIIAPLYAATLNGTLQGLFKRVLQITLPDGEAHKHWQTLNLIFDALLEHHCDRQTVLFALGGGVVGDMTGFAAASFMRGVPFVQVPTTLLAQVDSSVGGKTAINHPLGKNMIGAFYQPALVLCDLNTLTSLPPRELSAGLAEVIKYGPIADGAFFDWLEINMPRLLARDSDAMAYAVERSCSIKARIVGADEREQGLRAMLNFGHTFGHAIEVAAGYGVWLHGEAVAAGMVLAAQLSVQLGGIDAAYAARLTALIAAAGLPTAPPSRAVLSPARFLELMAHDKKAKAGHIEYILLAQANESAQTDVQAHIQPVPDTQVLALLERLVAP